MRRFVDVVVAAAALVALGPLILLLAGVVRCVLGKPAIFRQERTGRHGQPFTILKLRTMRPALRPNEPDRERIPSLGRFLRAASLDELPQLVNVLRGEMTLIGPRPTLPEQTAAYGPHERRRLEVRPGLTGWAQVNGRNSLTWADRIELDIWYIDHRSLMLDLRIVVRTLTRLLRPSGITAAGGVNPGFGGPQDPAGGEG